MKRMAFCTLAGIFFFAGLIAPPIAFSAKAHSGWKLVKKSEDGQSCTWGRGHVDNEAKRGQATTKNVISPATVGCPIQNLDLRSAFAGRLGVSASLSNHVTNFFCGGAGPAYNGAGKARIRVTANKISSSNCPGAMGHSYSTFSVHYRWMPSLNNYFAITQRSPSLNFN